MFLDHSERLILQNLSANRPVLKLQIMLCKLTFQQNLLLWRKILLLTKVLLHLTEINKLWFVSPKNPFRSKITTFYVLHDLRGVVCCVNTCHDKFIWSAQHVAALWLFTNVGTYTVESHCAIQHLHSIYIVFWKHTWKPNKIPMEKHGQGFPLSQEMLDLMTNLLQIEDNRKVWCVACEEILGRTWSCFTLNRSARRLRSLRGLLIPKLL